MLSVNQLQFDQVPVSQKNRKYTDVICIFIACIFAVVMFVISYFSYSQDNYYKIYYPSDTNGITCGYPDHKYQYLYFGNIQDIQIRVCVQTCPHASDKNLTCRNQNCGKKIQIYQSISLKNILGGYYCIPTQIQIRKTLYQRIIYKFDLFFLFQNQLVVLSIFITILIAIIYMAIFQLLPKITFFITEYGSWFLQIAFGIYLCFSDSKTWGIYSQYTQIFGICCILIGIFFLILNCIFYKQNKYCFVLLAHSTKFLSQSFFIYIYILSFLILTALFLCLIAWQHIAFTTSNTVTDNKIQHSNTSIILYIFNIIQFIWGIQFFKDSFNFILSGNSSQWYLRHKVFIGLPVKRIFKNNFGSILKGSFINGFLQIPQFLLYLIYMQPDGSCYLFSQFCSIGCGWLKSILQLVRTDSYTYINLTGDSFCNSSKNCSYLYSKSNFFVGSQSPFRMYRISNVSLLINLVFLICYILMYLSIGSIGFIELILISVLIYCFGNYFISLHSDAAEGLSITFLLQYLLSEQIYQNITRCPINLKKDIQQLQIDNMPRSKYQK